MTAAAPCPHGNLPPEDAAPDELWPASDGEGALLVEAWTLPCGCRWSAPPHRAQEP